MRLKLNRQNHIQSICFEARVKITDREGNLSRRNRSRFYRPTCINQDLVTSPKNRNRYQDVDTCVTRSVPGWILDLGLTIRESRVRDRKKINWVTTVDGCVHTADTTPLDFAQFAVGKFVQTRRDCRQLVANSFVIPLNFFEPCQRCV